MNIQYIEHFYDQEFLEEGELPDVLQTRYSCDGKEILKSTSVSAFRDWAERMERLEVTQHIMGCSHEVRERTLSFEDYFFNHVDALEIELYLKYILPKKEE